MKIQSTQRDSRLGLVLLAAILWGTTGVFVRALYGMTPTNALSIGFFRLAFSVPILLLACWFSGQYKVQVNRTDLSIMLLLGALTAAYQVCYFGAIARIGVAASTLITLCTAPVWVALLATVLLRERLTRRVSLAGILAIAGTLLLVGLEPGSTPNQQPAIGVLLALLSAMGYASLVLCSSRLANRYHPLLSVTISFSAAALILLPFSLVSGWVVNYSLLGWGFLLYLGAVPTALAYCLYFYGMRQTSAIAASLATLLEPLTSSLLAWSLFGERLGPFGLVGAMLLVGAIGLLYRGS